ncbi:MAG: signal recognition particle-docking protein FtsY [Actinomycetota bacterium]
MKKREEPKLSNSRSWLKRLKTGLRKSREKLTDQLSDIFSRTTISGEKVWDDLEEVLIQADVGINATLKIVQDLRERVEVKRIRDPLQILGLLKEKLTHILDDSKEPLLLANKLNVLIIVGVNGVGKTTAIAKIAHRAMKGGFKVLLAAADTFRAAAIEQLEIWGERVGAPVLKHQKGSDPAAVVYDSIHASRAREVNVLLIDTAGRLHTYVNLMEELKKIKRIATREAPEANIKTLLVIDATTGQNGIAQARLFDEALKIDGIILTKLDGTAKGGIVIAIADELRIPIKLIGVGERLEDLCEFDASEFVEALLSRDV